MLRFKINKLKWYEKLCLRKKYLFIHIRIAYIKISLKGSENLVNILIFSLTYYNHRAFEIKV